MATLWWWRLLHDAVNFSKCELPHNFRPILKLLCLISEPKVPSHAEETVPPRNAG
jgi:hypothetical protein